MGFKCCTIASWVAKHWTSRSSLHLSSKPVVNEVAYYSTLCQWDFTKMQWVSNVLTGLCELILYSLHYRPFGQCYEFLTLHTVKKYFLPVIEMVPQFLENLTDEELKKEAKNEAKNDALSMIIKSLKNLASRVPGQEETVKNLEIFRLKMILRWVWKIMSLLNSSLEIKIFVKIFRNALLGIIICVWRSNRNEMKSLILHLLLLPHSKIQNLWICKCF